MKKYGLLFNCRIIKICFISFLIQGIVFEGISQSPLRKVWHFKDLSGWVYGHQDSNPANQCDIEKGVLRIYTRANSLDRKKIHTEDKIYTTGRYIWKVYVPSMGMGDQSSVGAWIYSDDHHELDFEIGYGKQSVREEVGAVPGELLVYMTSQDFPYESVIKRIHPGWHLFEMDLSLKQGNYYVEWIIDKEISHTLQLEYGKEIPFFIFCSVENLMFLGDHPAQQENYGLFDFVKYKYHE